MQVMINAISSNAIASEEQAIGTFTHRKSKQLNTWPEWNEGEFKQLDQFHELGMCGDPIPRPPNATVL